VCSPGVNEGVNTPPRGQFSPQRAKLTPRGEVKNGPLLIPVPAVDDKE
jgi:hypothetical protein